ncbi:iron(III) transport system substrate-binding protein [Aquamicrobium lusatiense]|uniref:Iron(III) transport system substrate-binding protein n=1 Tax=Aquamicrobium lusatiense TaxID=89772 RepID=A0A7W9S4W9_9HYPH|nr:ABC transporter substrate-binding protein [Aquamicrobium lusatiense]MBB6014182.1 iron(III) transport system substrate-binding protein [Aquamicrobium lusatiense]
MSNVTNPNRWTLRAALAALAFSTAMGLSAAHADSITVYTSYEEDEIAAFLEKAKADLPDLDVNVLRLSTGDLHARILAEAANPQHDVIWGWAVTSMIDPRIGELLEAYQPQGIDRIADQFRDKDGKWFATTGYMAAFCVNNEVLKAKNLPMPTSWADLTKPEYKGEVVMPNPASSGTGYLMIASILQMMGEEKGWEYLKALDANIAQYIKSGSRPCNAASEGEFAIGASFALRAIKNIGEGYPITMVIPSEGAGNELEANALMAGSKNKDAARRFLDWTVSENAVNEYYNWKEIVTATGGAMPQKFRDAGLPEDISSVMWKMDFASSAENRALVLERWQRELER